MNKDTKDEDAQAKESSGENKPVRRQVLEFVFQSVKLREHLDPFLSEIKLFWRLRTIRFLSVLIFLFLA